MTRRTHSPSLAIGMGYVPSELVKAGTAMEIEIRGKRVRAIFVPNPICWKS